MATYKGVMLDNNGRIRTGTSSDDADFVGTVTASQGLTVSAGGANVTGNSSISGNLTVTGTLFSQDEEQVLVKDNFLDLNFGYVGTSYEQTGITFNFQATSTGVSIDTSANSVAFTAGSGSARAKVVASQASDIGSIFALGDIIQISGTTNAENDGLYVVQTNAVAGTVEIKTSVFTPPDAVNAKFALLNFTTETESTATALTIRKVNLLSLRSSNAGVLQSATGAVDSSFSSYTEVGAASTLQVAYDAGNTITTDASGAITFTLSDDGQGLSVQGSSGGTGNVSIGGTTAVNAFIVGASGAASSITSTGQDLTLQTATSGAVTLRSAGVMTVDSDDSMAITLDADDNSAKTITIQANNTNAGASKEANIVLDADDNVNTLIAGTRILGIDSAGGVIYGGQQFALANTANNAQFILMDGSNGSIAFDQADGTANVISKAATAAADDLEIKVTGNFDASLLLESAGSGSDALKIQTVTNAGSIDINSAAAITMDSAGASSFTATGGDFTVQTATSGAMILRSVGTTTIDSDDSLTIQMDANNAGNKRILIQSNNTGGGEAMIDLDADNEIALQIAGSNQVELTSSSAVFTPLVQASSANGLRFGSAPNVTVTAIQDQDNMAADSDTALATQQSIKAYVDSRGVSNFSNLVTVTADGTGLAAGDVVAIISSGGSAGQATKADASAIETGQVIGVAIEAISGGGTGRVASSGSMGGYSGLTAGSRQYLSETAGALTATAPSTASSVIVQVGFAISTTTIVIQPVFIAENG